MKWRAPNKQIFWVPVPYTGQNKTEIVNWQTQPGTPRKTFELTDPETGKIQNCEILDYLGTYPIKQLPNFLARDCTDNPKITGAILGNILIQKKPEFKKVDNVLFYQLTKI